MVVLVDAMLNQLEERLERFKDEHREALRAEERAKQEERRTAMLLQAMENSIANLTDLRNRLAGGPNW